MRSLTLVILASALITAGVAQQQPQSGAKTQQPCSELQRRQLDVWIGSWDLTWPGNTAGEVAHGTTTLPGYSMVVWCKRAFLGAMPCPCEA
jgi:disulfide bond formation protein DsbB